jgi:hypothetical protein
VVLLLIDLESESSITSYAHWWQTRDRFQEVHLNEIFLSNVAVRLQIGGLDLLGFQPEDGPLPWQEIPVLDFARSGLLAVRRAKVLGGHVYDMPGTGQALLFKAIGDKVLVHSTTLEMTASVPYQKLLSAWTEFTNRITDLVLRSMPGIEKTEGWEDWFVTRDDPLAGEFHNWRGWIIEHEECFNRVDAVEPDAD